MKNNKLILEKKCMILKISNAFSIFYLYFGIIIRLCNIQIDKVNGKIHEDEGIISLGMLSELIIEFMFNMIQPLWFLHDHRYREFHTNRPGCEGDSCHIFHYFITNDLLLLFSIFIKIIPVLVFIIHSNKVDPKAARCASIYGIEVDFIFSLKMWMVQNPLLLVALAFSSSITLLGLSINIFERQLDGSFA